jgi:Polyketide cyclase / dehydrase and lipid transport
VWDYLRRIAGHVEWMADAVAIRFTTDQHEGVGTAFETDTKVGPFRLKDEMVITEWEPGRVMGIRHTGVVTGTGRFTLSEVPGDGDRISFTRFTWEEELRFPVWMGGALGGRAGAPVLKHIWQRNLANLRRHFE